MNEYILKEMRVGKHYVVFGAEALFVCRIKKGAHLSTQLGAPILSINPRERAGRSISFDLDYFKHSLKYVNASLTGPTITLVSKTTSRFTWKRSQSTYTLVDHHDQRLMEFTPKTRYARSGLITELIRMDPIDSALLIISLCFLLSRSPSTKFKKLINHLSIKNFPINIAMIQNGSLATTL